MVYGRSCSAFGPATNATEALRAWPQTSRKIKYITEHETTTYFQTLAF